MEKYLVTSALPYANGPLHIGHVAGAYLPADIFVRFKRLKGDDVVYVCGTDEHGAPISIKAESEGVTAEEIVERYHNSMKKSFAGLLIDFDNFSGTSREAHKKLSQDFFLNLLERGFVVKKKNKQWFDEEKQRFLADRYVEGDCPHCGSEGARGDQCDSCGKLIDAVTLINPVSKISGSKPVLKETTNWYLELQKFEEELKLWLGTKTYWKDNVHNFISNFLENGLIERAITRDIDWGVKVPLKDAEGKVLYVWFDAPIGYISSTIEWAEKIGKPEKWKDYWLDKKTKLIHFIGKDNIIFHTIFFPSFLMEQKLDYVLPYDVPANEFLNLEGRKMSTSKNWTVWVKDFLTYFDGEFLRYYLAANAPENKDSDFSWKEFQGQINNDLNNILGNLANRTFVFGKKYFDCKVDKPEKLNEISVKALTEADELIKEIEKSYDNYHVRKAVKLSLEIARIGNKYFDETQPWKSVKIQKKIAEETLYVCSQLLAKISIVLSPILPESMKKLRSMMDLSDIKEWDQNSEIITQYNYKNIEPLFRKIEDSEIDNQISLLNKVVIEEPKELEHKDNVEFDDFMKMEFRVVKVIKAEKIKKSKKLLKLKVQIAGEERTVVSGIAGDYQPEDIIGKEVAMLLNLKPRKIMGIESQAMILAAHNGNKLSILIPDKQIESGSEIS